MEDMEAADRQADADRMQEDGSAGDESTEASSSTASSSSLAAVDSAAPPALHADAASVQLQQDGSASNSEGSPETVDDSGLNDDDALALLEGATGGKGKKPNKRLQKKHEKAKERKHAQKAQVQAPISSSAAGSSSSAAGMDISVEYQTGPDLARQLKESGDETLAAFANVFSSFNRLAGRSEGVSAAQAAAGFVAVGEDGKLKTEAEVAKERREAEKQRKAAAEEDEDGGSDLDDDDLLDEREPKRRRKDNDDANNNDEDGGAGLSGEAGKTSRKQRKLALMASLPDLKRSVSHPEVVDAFDVFSSDPHLLAHLKSFRNTVPVPRHWCKKSRYLQRSKLGMEKPAFQLPTFIADTGITKLRNADLESADEKTLKAKQRDRYVPKMGRIEIEYTVLHDAFFKYQTKPRMSGYGDLYYEGRELEAAKTAAAHYAATKKPGIIGDRLREALGMPLGITSPPPWLTKMQQYGPPPSYPRLLIPGVNAPLPAGGSYGLQPGGWGRPPCDQFGNPLYGPVFGPPEEAPLTYSITLSTPNTSGAAGSAVAGAGAAAAGGSAAGAPALPSMPSNANPNAPKRILWGDLGSSAGGVPGVTRGASAAIIKPTAGTATATATGAGAAAGGAGAGAGAGGAPAAADGTATPAAGGGATSVIPADGTLSVPTTALLGGIETPALVDLRKGKRAPGVAASVAGIDTPSTAGGGPQQPQQPAPALYQVLEQRQTGLQGGLLATTHAYVIPSASSSSSSSSSSASNRAAPVAAVGGIGEDENGASASSSSSSSAVAIAVAPEDLERGDASAILAQRYQQEVSSAAQSKAEALRVAKGIGKEGVDEVIEEHERKRSRKEAGLDKGSGGNGAAGGGGNKGKKSNAAKDFKF